MTPEPRADVVTKPAVARSALANGSRLFFGNIDQRSSVARLFRDVYEAICADLGGRESMSEAEYQLARRAASLSVECARAETRQAEGHALDVERYCRATNSLGRVLGTLGIKRRARDITPSLASYIEEGAAE